jgi:hypothetical protein
MFIKYVRQAERYPLCHWNRTIFGLDWSWRRSSNAPTTFFRDTLFHPTHLSQILLKSSCSYLQIVQRSEFSLLTNLHVVISCTRYAVIAKLALSQKSFFHAKTFNVRSTFIHHPTFNSSLYLSFIPIFLLVKGKLVKTVTYITMSFKFPDFQSTLVHSSQYSQSRRNISRVFFLNHEDLNGEL